MKISLPFLSKYRQQPLINMTALQTKKLGRGSSFEMRALNTRSKCMSDQMKVPVSVIAQLSDRILILSR